MGRERKRRIRLLPAALAAGFLFLACGFAGTLPRGASVGGVDVSRLTLPAAAAKVRAALEEELAGRTFTVCAGEDRVVFGPPALHYETDLYSALQAAARRGGAVPLRKRLRVAGLEGAVRGLCDGLFRQGRAARAVFRPQEDPPFAFEPAAEGRYVDGAALLRAAEAALAAGEREVRAEPVNVPPSRSEEEVRRSVRLLGTFSTSFNGGNAPRAHNIALAAAALNGCVLAAGETFSFNARTGPRTAEQGYREAPVILEGEFVAGVGGGVCQVSTTLYNAALLAGMQIAEYHPHSLAVGYVEPSFDAMVSGTACDLKFRNAGAGPVYLVCRVNGQTLTASLYGPQSAVTYLRESVVTATVPPPEPERREAAEERELRAPKDGVKSEGWLIRREEGRPDERILLRRDSYAPVRGLSEGPLPREGQAGEIPPEGQNAPPAGQGAARPEGQAAPRPRRPRLPFFPRGGGR